MNKYIPLFEEYDELVDSVDFPSVYDKDGKVDILDAKIYDKYHYIIRTENIHAFSNKPTEMKVAYNLKGDYIGGEDDAKEICKKRGIKPEVIEGHKVCSIGFNEEEQKWYGWSHRAIYGFTIGSEVDKKSSAFEASNKDEFLDSLKAWYVEDDLYSNVKFTHTDKGVQIDYDIIPNSLKESHGRIMGIINRINTDRVNELSVLKYFTNKVTEFNPLNEMLQDYVTLHNINEKAKITHTSHFEEYPEEWGMGTWTAKTLEDAKLMAIAFAKSVS